MHYLEQTLIFRLVDFCLRHQTRRCKCNEQKKFQVRKLQMRKYFTAESATKDTKTHNIICAFSTITHLKKFWQINSKYQHNACITKSHQSFNCCLHLRQCYHNKREKQKHETAYQQLKQQFSSAIFDKPEKGYVCYCLNNSHYNCVDLKRYSKTVECELSPVVEHLHHEHQNRSTDDCHDLFGE